MSLRPVLATLLVASASLPATTAQEPSRLDVLVGAISRMADRPAAQATMLKGMLDALQGCRGVPAPQGWDALYSTLAKSDDATVRDRAQALAVIFGGGAAMEEMRRTFLDATAPAEARKKALDALVAQRDAAALDGLLALLASPSALREPALRGLASYEDARIAPAIVAAFPQLDTGEKTAALQTLLSRPAGALAFTAAIDAGKVAKGELTAPLARQMQALKDATLDAWLAKKWGAMQAPSADKQKEIAKYKEFLHQDVLLRADASRGRALFNQACAVCHNLHGTGGHIGPELTGGYEDVDYLLVNILDPNAIIGKDYQQTFIKTRDGKNFTGVVTQDTERALSFRALSGEVITLEKSDILSTEVSSMSMMPEGLLTPMDEDSVRDLFLYLRQKRQVPTLLTALNGNDVFNGVDLKGWQVSDAAAWRVEGGEIIGKAGREPVSLTSEMVADDYRLTAQVQVKGASLAVEWVISGQQDTEQFHGVTLSFGGLSAVNLWDYRAATMPVLTTGKIAFTEGTWHTVELLRASKRLRVSIDGKTQFELPDPRHRRRVNPTFVIHGEDGELRMKALRVELPQ